MIRRLRTALLVLLLAAIALAVLGWHLSWHPAPHAPVTPVCKGAAPLLAPGQPLKVMTWNVQFLAGKRYLFWYDAPDGPDRTHDDRPSAEDIAHDLDEVVRVIREEQPDVILLQELDDGAKASGYQNQLALLQERLVDLYPCSVEAFDWKATFVPDPRVFGSVGRKVATLSRYRIDQAERWQLPNQAHWLSLFQPQRVLLAAYLPLPGGEHLAILNTRLEPYRKSSDAQAQQLQAVAARVDRLEGLGTPWANTHGWSPASKATTPPTTTCIYSGSATPSCPATPKPAAPTAPTGSPTSRPTPTARTAPWTTSSTAPACNSSKPGSGRKILWGFPTIYR